MKGSIRFFLGLLLTFGAVGGIEVAMTNAEFLQSTIIAIVGLAIMFSGVNALSKENL